MEQRGKSLKIKVVYWSAASFCLVVLSVLFVLPANAQTSYGGIVGSVADVSGAAVPGATVTLTNIGTNETRTLTSGTDGGYRFVNLQPANYRLVVEMTGFKRLTREPVQVTVGASLRIDAALEVGAVSETVAVSAEAPLIQAESSSVGQVIEGRHVLEMPLNGRNPMNLIALVPGVVPGGSTSGSPAGNQTSSSSGSHTSEGGWGNYQIGGGIAGQSATFVDGGSMNTGGGNSLGFVISQDAVQEFRVETNNVSAEFGRFSGGVVNMATKSGSNAWHGSAYEYLRNKVLNASNYFAGKQAWVQNQYGANATGPILKDKSFFMFAWEDFRLRFGIPVTAMVPTAKQRTGDFSSDLPIYDPLLATRTQFANNKIPSNRIDQNANAMVNTYKYWPDETNPGQTYNYRTTTNGGVDQRQYNARVDHNLGSMQRLFARYTYSKIDDLPYDPLKNQFTAMAANHMTGQQAVFGDTITLSARTILDVRLSYMRNYIADTAVVQNFDFSKMSAAMQNLSSISQYPLAPNVMILNGIQTFAAAPVNSFLAYNNYGLSAAMTRIQGRHTLKFGAEIRLLDGSTSKEGQPNGLYKFNSNFTTATGSSSTTSGNAFASFMLGYPYQAQVNYAAWTAAYSWYQGYYLNDAFELSKKLTLNLGVRWELPGAMAERHDLNSVLLPEATDALSSSTGISLKGQLALVNSSQWAHRTIPLPKYNLFAPRVGLTYRIDSQTVASVGYGISYLPNNQFGGLPSASPAAFVSTIMLNSLNNAGKIPYNTLSNPFPATGYGSTASVQQSILRPPLRDSAAYLANVEGTSVTGMLSQDAYPYVQQWNTRIEHQFKGNLMVGVGYTGNKGTHLPDGQSLNLNQLDPSYYTSMTSAQITASVTNPFYGKVRSTNTLGGSTTSAGQLKRPHPQFTDFIAVGTQRGSAIYHAGMVKVEKRFGGGGLLMGNYTYAKIIGDADTGLGSMENGKIGVYQNFYDYKSERSLLTGDVRHRFVASYVLDLPFGKGQKFLANVPSVLNRAVSGWGVNGIVTFQSGFPLSIVAGSTTLSSSFGGGTPRPVVASGCETSMSGSSQQRVAKWFNTACFSQPGGFAFGNESRVDSKLRAAGIANYDFTLFKNTTITERTKLQFRIEAFNLFNRVQLAPPDTTLSNTTTFGAISSQANTARLLQAALRFTF